MDFLYTVGFFVMIAFLNVRIRSITDRIEGTVISPADYSVYVQGLPPNASEDDVEAHFNKLYNLREPDWTYPGTCSSCYCTRKPASMRRKQYADKGVPPDHPILPVNTREDAATAAKDGAPPGGFRLLTSVDLRRANSVHRVGSVKQRTLDDADVYPVYRESAYVRGSAR